MKKTIKKAFWLTVGVFAIVAMYITLYEPDQLVDPSFKSVASLTKAPIKTSSVNAVKASTAKTTSVVTPVSVGTTTPKTGTSTPVAGTASTQSGTNTTNSGTTEPANCAPNATSQDPCKLGQCFGYPYGICESNPNQGTLDKDCASTSCTDPDANYYDLWGNEFDYQGNLIQYSSECVDPVSGAVNTYNPTCN